eukprot:CAMPEP_0173190898 /NCGR_PEP_ID=MMETSP1141-20130122/12595_1 /TAXON_ID=483371 /ORGANISM="non described non described, Strain CCMP2298" /LENGTH=58 /DNA_ID=CAMNT_0014115047 /DNA_START=371 /DNA_END=547 /DNA_ORIENTATION=+
MSFTDCMVLPECTYSHSSMSCEKAQATGMPEASLSILEMLSPSAKKDSIRCFVTTLFT